MSLLSAVEKDRCTNFSLLLGSEIRQVKISFDGKIHEIVDIVIHQVKQSIHISDVMMNKCFVDVASFGKLHRDGADSKRSHFLEMSRQSRISLVALLHSLLETDGSISVYRKILTATKQNSII